MNRYLKLLAIYALLFMMCTISSCTNRGTSHPKVSPPGSPDASQVQSAAPEESAPSAADSSEANLAASLVRRYQDIKPTQWGVAVTGVKTRLDTSDKVVALTFDACGGKGGSGYDKKLIDYLIKENVPATLFINGRWIDENKVTFLALAKNRLFEIENHGAEHKPLSVTGLSADNIAGTRDVCGVIDEVLPNADKINMLTGRMPLLFRSGTDYYDEVAVQIVTGLGEQAVGYSVLGDAGATFTAPEIKKACLSAKPGDIIICHMNHPEKDTAEGIMEAVPALRAEGFRFVRLDDYRLK